jgi:N-acetylneuraminic acid mutarotase
MSASFSAHSLSASDDLTFDDRVRAQEKIERAYYSHQNGARLPFEEAVQRSLLEMKVETYLRQSAALEEFWHTPITASALDAELERISGHTRFPERLQELYAALGNDSFLIKECFVRSILADRLSRSFFSNDERVHGSARHEADALRAGLEKGQFEVLAAPDPPARLEYVPTHSGAQRRVESAPDREGLRFGPAERVADEGSAYVIRIPYRGPAHTGTALYVVDKLSWDSWWAANKSRWNPAQVRAVAGSSPLPVPVSGTAVQGQVIAGASGQIDESCFAGVWDTWTLNNPPAMGFLQSFWTGNAMISWTPGGGVRYDPLTDVFTPISSLNSPPYANGPGVWTGREIIIWGETYVACSTCLFGGRYDPTSDSWRPVSTINAPRIRDGQSAVWTGTEMIVWGGQALDLTLLNDGALYNPATDTWRPMTLASAPSGRKWHGAVWTGEVMIVWGGTAPQLPQPGGRYDPRTDTWLPMTTTGAPESRNGHPMVWTGSEMIVWGGAIGSTLFGTGGRYDPVSDRWQAMSSVGAPSPSQGPAVWTGSEFLIWGGSGATSGRYDPSADSWRPITSVNAPSDRVAHSLVWADGRAIVFGGYDTGVALSTGGRYDPLTDSWTPTYGTPARPIRHLNTTVWTGTQMIVWGGIVYPWAPTGERYDPLADSWMPTSITGAPSARVSHAAVWSGRWMVVWGGSGTNTGGRYDPITDTWLPTSLANAPIPRSGHKLVWMDNDILLVGGWESSQPKRYDPELDYWSDVATAGAAASVNLVPVWTGKEVITWGGDLWGSDKGAAYNPSTNLWRSLSRTGAPSERTGHTAIWTGKEMIVWGGYGNSRFLADGARYDPVTDSWRPVSADGAPTGRYSHTAVWTGDLMILWGGQEHLSYGSLSTGGQYDPLRNVWRPTPAEGVRGRSGHTAVWTGSEMIVYSGNTGLRFILPALPDDDGDGFFRCRGDCDDSAPDVYPGAAQICSDGLNNDCHHQFWPALTATNDGDDDEDGFSECAGDCNDSLPRLYPASDETCDSVDNDCDGVVDDPVADQDHDGVGELCDTCPAVNNPAQSETAACMQLTEDGGDCLEALVQPVQGGPPGEVLLYGDASPLPTSLTFELNISSCDRVDPIEFALNGMRLGTYSDAFPGCYCKPELQTMAIDDLWALLAWAPGTLNVIGIRKEGAPSPPDSWLGTFVGWIRLVIRQGSALSTVCLFDADGGDCSEPDECVGGSTEDALSIDTAIDDPFHDSVARVGGAAGLSPTLIDVRALPDGPCTMCFAGAHEADCITFRKQGEIAMAINGAPCGGLVASAGGNTTAECTSPSGALVSLDASLSTAPGVERSEVQFKWFELRAGVESPLGSGERLDVTLPLGLHQIKVRVSDPWGRLSTDEATIQVVDTMAPSVSSMATPDVLWPPNHRMVPVTVASQVHDACDPSPTAVLSFMSSEEEDAPGTGDGSTAPDIEVTESNALQANVLLRAERAAGGGGRLYTILVDASDQSGNHAFGTVGVLIPHDRSGQAEPLSLDMAPGEIRWSPVAGAHAYNVVRSALGSVSGVGGYFRIDGARCIGRSLSDTAISGPMVEEDPPAGQGFLFLVEYVDVDSRPSGYGTAEATGELVITSGDSCH